MRDLQNSSIIVIKGFLFLLMGLFSGFLLLSSVASLQNVFLLGITIWSFCRFYYFLFHVLENYVDERLKYRGIVDLMKTWWTQRKSR